VLQQISSQRVAVIGDVCLDLYLFLSDVSEDSLETGLPTQIVERVSGYLGGAGNVAANCAALGAGEVALYGVIGDDLYGREILHLCETLSIRTAGLERQPDEWHTNVYTKPYRRDTEQSRLDIGTLNRLQAQTAITMLQRLREELPSFDVVIINQQVTNGLHSPEFRRGLTELIGAIAGTPVFLDSRNFPDDYVGSIRKLNLSEARRTPEAESFELLRGGAAGALAQRLVRRWGAPVYLTRGESGCIVATENAVFELPAVAVEGPVDPVGAGDSMLAAAALAHAAGAPHDKAAAIGVLAAGVTVRKRFRTGVATPDEILKLSQQAEYIHNADLASHPSLAVYHQQSHIEIVAQDRQTNRGGRKPPLRYAIFDHDGTISAVREGWEGIMDPVMCEAVLGRPPEEVPAEELRVARARVRELIDRTTGVQTIVQMQELVSLVEEFGRVAGTEIKSAEEYKAIYNERLIELVRERLTRLHRGELAVDDLTIKNAVPLLRRLREAGTRMYLASGTDEQDVRVEAEALGYADLFEGGIVGSVGDAENDPKSLVLRRILKEIGAENASAVITFGDGPVEIRETRKLGGFTVGVASDEVRRYGLNLHKRRRLIRAGADIVVPDYSQLEDLMAFLGLEAADASKPADGGSK